MVNTVTVKTEFDQKLTQIIDDAMHFGNLEDIVDVLRKHADHIQKEIDLVMNSEKGIGSDTFGGDCGQYISPISGWRPNYDENK